MIYEVFSIHDSKAEAFLPPFILPNEAMAKRVFAQCVNSDSHQFGASPPDYTLFRLGQFDDSTGQFLLERSKHSLGNGVEFRSLDRPKSPEISTNGQDSSIPEIHNVASISGDSTGEHTPE